MRPAEKNARWAASPGNCIHGSGLRDNRRTACGVGARGGGRTHTTRKRQGILSPPRMPFRHPGLRCESVRILSHSCNRTGSAWKVWVSADASDCFQIGVRTHRNQKKRRKCIRPRTQAGVRRRISCQKRIDLFLDRPATGPGSNSF